MRSVLAPRRLACFALALALGTLCCPAADAAISPIVWGSAQTVSGDGDVDTTGSLVYAFTFGGTTAPATATVNGVTFSPFTIPGGIIRSATTGNVVLTEAPGTLFGSNALGAGSGPFSALSGSYQSLLGSGAYADVPSSITVSLGGLTAGQQYRVQWWTNNSSNGTSIYGGSFTSTTATAVNAVTLDANTTDVVGGVGQFAIGTFTAVGATQPFTLTETAGGVNPLINALQVRAVPEPSTSAIVIAGLVCGVGSMWRKRPQG